MQWVPEKKMWPNLQEKFVSSPQAEQESNFLGNWGDLDGGSG